MNRRLEENFPGGELQRAPIARALAVRPDFIVLDEALSSLDASVQVEILRLLPALTRRRIRLQPGCSSRMICVRLPQSAHEFSFLRTDGQWNRFQRIASSRRNQF